MLNEKNTRFDGGIHSNGVERVERVGVVVEKENNIIEKPSGSSDNKEERAMEK